MNNQFGLSAALALPISNDGSVDLEQVVKHASWCLNSGCRSTTVFGTTGEGPSLAISERIDLLDAIAGSGIHLRKHVICGVSASAVQEAVSQARLFLDRDCHSLLLAPPFYYKGVNDDGLYRWFSNVFNTLGPQARDVILYHIPSVTGVSLTVDLVTRLRQAFPEIIVGVKDSSGDFEYTRCLLAQHCDLKILIGDERSLAKGMKLGAQGSISGLANICPSLLVGLIQDGAHNETISSLVDAVLKYPVVPAVKALVAKQFQDEAWLNVLAPLVPLTPAQLQQLYATTDVLLVQKTV